MGIIDDLIRLSFANKVEEYSDGQLTDPKFDADNLTVSFAVKLDDKLTVSYIIDDSSLTCQVSHTTCGELTTFRPKCCLSCLTKEATGFVERYIAASNSTPQVNKKSKWYSE